MNMILHKLYINSMYTLWKVKKTDNNHTQNVSVQNLYDISEIVCPKNNLYNSSFLVLVTILPETDNLFILLTSLDVGFSTGLLWQLIFLVAGVSEQSLVHGFKMKDIWNTETVIKYYFKFKQWYLYIQQTTNLSD